MVMNSNLRNTRAAACLIAVSCMILDDLPEPQYNTFNDPGASAMLSLILAVATTVSWHRGWKFLAVVGFVPAFLLKFFIQPVFWIRNAETIDLATLFAAMGMLGFLAIRKGGLALRFTMGFLALMSVASALVALQFIGLDHSGWLAFWWLIATARVLIPYAFWSTIILGERWLIQSEVRIA